MKKLFNKYKEAMPLIITSSIAGSAIATCILIIAVGKKDEIKYETL